MSYRFMRIILFFDLPTLTDKDKREYRKFRKFLIKNGFIMLQESVYTRMVLNKSVQKSVMNQIRKNKPSDGLVQTIVITEKQFTNMESIVGEYKTDIVDSDERLIII